MARYKSCPSPVARLQLGHELYLRHLPLVRKTLARFCPMSRCHPGGCLVEELVGETYPVFRQALDGYEPSFGVDFLGYVGRRLYWGLEHRARRLERAVFRRPPPELADGPGSWDGAEERLLGRLFAEEILARLDPNDAALVAGYAAGHTCRELAESLGVAAPALRKRLQRLRARLRSLGEPGGADGSLLKPESHAPAVRS